ncbi:hypothetical protein Zmor_028262 [Zophobas morio]|uniref:Fatty acid desaturase domain-containing protein n=1 Tax=Zophobas morio TaxID=2755281 RepID=A0AA38M3U3_9CUCU|nr:hypothetical protein Zmor_028262 [Zophobas morio]
MAPNPLGKSNYYSSAEPVQIISKPGVQQDVQRYQPKIDRSATPKYRWQVVWRNVLIFVYLHVAAFYGIYYFFTAAKALTLLYSFITVSISSLGVTMGAHRLWAHRSYKAKFPLRVLLMICQTVALQNDVYEWVRDHRVHHKFTDTDADPHNSNRGFFFSHMGWLLVKKHRDVYTKGKGVPMDDVAADPVVMFQRKYYLILAPLFCFILPSLIPCWFWNENFNVSWHVNIFRYLVVLHGTWCVNSAAHMWGSKPFDKNINACDNRAVAFVGFGEGWHNYHHVFPWDYKAAELGNYSMNGSTAVLDFMAKIGWAYDLKTVNVEMVANRAKRTGDGSRTVWGWGDVDMKPEEIEMADIHHKKKE